MGLFLLFAGMSLKDMFVGKCPFNGYLSIFGLCPVSWYPVGTGTRIVNPNPYRIRIQELSGSSSTH